jgi:protein involved in polysaccharide export with SLBB domain
MRILLLTLVCCFTIGLTNAQVLSNNSRNNALITQMVNAYRKAKQMGLSDAEIKYQLVKRGYTSQMVDQAKKLAQAGISPLKSSNLDSDEMSDDTSNLKTSGRDTSWIFKTPLQKEPSKYFGYSFFTQAFANFSPDNNIATPKQYVLGPGDNLKILISGQNYREINEYINTEGKINIPYIGLISLAGMSIDASEQLLRNKLSALYPAIKTGNTKVDISLGELRTIQVIVSGEAETPGSYTVSSLTNFFNLLYLSGGPTEKGSLRNIQLIRNNKTIATIDFYEFLTNGKIQQNIRLEDQDNIFFPVYGQRIQLNGEVKTSSIFELKQQESLASLLKYAGGFSENAFKESVTVFRNESNSRKVINVEEKDFSNFMLENGDQVSVGQINNLFTNRIVLTGEVKRAGYYGIKENDGLKKLINNAGGLSDEAFSNRGIIHRKMPGLQPQIIPFDAKAILNGKQEDIGLYKNDSIVVFSAENFKTSSFVTINGSVKNPGRFTYNRGMKAEDLIAMAGGFTIDAAIHKVELSRLEKNNSDKLSNEVLMLQKIKVDSFLNISDKSTALEPFDEIVVPRLLNYQLIGNVKIRGEILYEGDYGLEKRDQTVIELIQRAGGISPYASLEDVQVFRNGLRIGSNKFREGRPDEINVRLLPGDSIYLPRKNQFVTISGQVYNEQIVDFESPRLMHYISSVGGIKSTGNSRKIYVQYPNGMYKKTKKFLFVKSYPRVKPGSKIIVPEKTEADKNRLQIAELTGLASLLTSLVAIFSILKN